MGPGRRSTHLGALTLRTTTVTTTKPQLRPARWIAGRLAVCGAVLALLAGCAGSPTSSDAGTATGGTAATIAADSAAATTAAPSTTTADPTVRTSAPATDVRTAQPSSAAPTAPPASTTPRRPTSTRDAPTSPPPSITDAIKPAPGAVLLPPAEPVSLSVPAIGVTASLIDLGRNPDGTIEVPSLDDPSSPPGWYRNSPPPGTLGPAIILGHIDSRQFGPGVFYSLKDLQQGDAVDVTRDDGSVAMFTVDAVKTVAKKDFPTLEVYGNIDHAGLRLITCGGEFDPDARSYESNVIVFASLVGSRSA